MTSWVYLFSKITAEALLFEGLAITFLCAAYAGFWVLRKRRMGVIKNDVPVGVVKTYLNELIFDAEQLRAQLFGLLAANGMQVPAAAFQAAPQATQTVTVQDPEIIKKVVFLESKMAEQAQAMSGLLAEKARIEKELADARAQGGASPSEGAGDGEVRSLRDKVQNLEAKLAEYSVIEDDLANLKRLQQENQQLKSALSGAPGAAPATAPGKAAPAPAPKAAAAAAVAAAAPATEAEEPTPVSAMPEEIAAGAADSAFEGLVDHVEKSLEQEAPAAAAAAETEAEASSPPLVSTSIPQPATVSKSDEDLVAEFEKMLSS